MTDTEIINRLARLIKFYDPIIQNYVDSRPETPIYSTIRLSDIVALLVRSKSCEGCYYHGHSSWYHCATCCRGKSDRYISENEIKEAEGNG